MSGRVDFEGGKQLGELPTVDESNWRFSRLICFGNSSFGKVTSRNQAADAIPPQASPKFRNFLSTNRVKPPLGLNLNATTPHWPA